MLKQAKIPRDTSALFGLLRGIASPRLRRHANWGAGWRAGELGGELGSCHISELDQMEAGIEAGTN